MEPTEGSPIPVSLGNIKTHPKWNLYYTLGRYPDYQVTEVSLDKTELSLRAGGSTAALTARVISRKAKDTAVTWTSSNDKIAAVDDNGVVTPVAEGKALITAEAGGLKASCDVTVIAAAPVEEFTVTFVDGLGNTLKTETVEKGKAATAPADPARDGYLFSGWDTDFSCVTDNMTVIAQWKQNDSAPVSINGAEVILSAASFTYNGKSQRPTIQTIGGESLIFGTDYQVAWPADDSGDGSL